MNDIIEQNEKRQIECNKRADELYKKLFAAADNAAAMVSSLNDQKIRIFFATVRLFIKRLQNR